MIMRRYLFTITVSTVQFLSFQQNIMTLPTQTINTKGSSPSEAKDVNDIVVQEVPSLSLSHVEGL